jgi:hypothetical protein
MLIHTDNSNIVDGWLFDLYAISINYLYIFVINLYISLIYLKTIIIKCFTEIIKSPHLRVRRKTRMTLRNSRNCKFIPFNFE